MHRHPSFRLVASVIIIGTGTPVEAQTYPHRPIRIVTSAIGGGNDFNARILAHGLAPLLNQQIVVDNRGGAFVPPLTAARATPDGYTLLAQNNGIWTAPLLEKAPYDYEKDLAPITLIARSPNILVVHPSLGANSIKELIAMAKANPGTINYASGVVGASNHLAAELFKYMAGVNLTRISYKGSGPALNDVVSGQVKIHFGTTGAVTPHIRSGRLKGLAVTSAEPSPLAPGLPTVSASGVPGYVAETTYGLWAPAKTPDAILARINRDTVKILNTVEIRERMLNGGVEPVGSTAQAFAAEIRSEAVRMDKVVRAAGLRVE
jgi:tripartite-type tricarboxylate transporter receptor subunit TctC